MNTKKVLLKLKKDLELTRKIAIPICTQGHKITLDYKVWNDPVDGLDYAIHLIDKQLKKP